MSVAHRELVRGLAALATAPHLSAGGLPALDHLLHLGQYALGASGMAIAERDGTGGRVVAATGTSSWALGRPIAPAMMAAATRRDRSTYRIELTDLDEESADQFASRGCDWLLIHRIGSGERPQALIGAMFGAAERADSERVSALALLGATLDGLYRSRNGLPIHDREPLPGHDDRELLIAITSHELRTPVTVIKGYADTLRDHWEQLDDPTRRDAARVIGQRADELARLVDRLLTASISAQAMTLDLAPFDLVCALHRAVAELPVDLQRRVRADLPESLPPAWGDVASIANVVTELVTNATKYSPTGEPVVITADADRRTVHFQVADRGIGIALDQAHRAFERFWQGDTGDKRRYGGAGLGLYLVRKTIERQHGWVSLRPRDGGGTLAEVRLPRGDLAGSAVASGEA